MSRDYKQFYAILKTTGMEKEEAVMIATEGRTESLRAMTDVEYSDMISKLQVQKSSGKSWAPKPGDMQRKKMISIARQMNWHLSTNRPIQDKGIQMIMYRLDGWCLAQKFKKSLMQHTEQELNVLVSIFEEKVFKSYLKDLNK
ncbi:hypothetical protein [Rhodonellum sp.]|uniref:hypothetical protein n=1 Tax=Rhodonellum sp. TaxID=2231180 RepID=UPI002724FD95|nr:hypothetical protein [Rhodonellum sp.]MDO9554551.1 hypothetical protein [Rhodonellum sp.]